MLPPAPRLGEHNRDVLSRLTSATPEMIAELDRRAERASVFQAGGH